MERKITISNENSAKVLKANCNKWLLLVVVIFALQNVTAQVTLNNRASGNWSNVNTWLSPLQTGTITTGTGTANVTGSGTAFTNLTVGTVLYRNNGTTAIGTIQSINSNTSITLTANAANNNTGVTFMVRKVPSAGDTVTVSDGMYVDVDMAAACNSLTIAGGTDASDLTITGTNSLTVTGAVTINPGTGNGDDKLVIVNAGTLSCASVSIAQTGNDNRSSEIRLTTGTVNVTGNITMAAVAARNAVVFTSNGVLNIGGTMTGGGLTASTGTVNYNGGAQSIGTYTYNNLTLSNNGNKTLSTGTVVNGTVSVEGTAVLVQGAANLIGNSSIIRFNGGTYRTGASAGFAETVGDILLVDDSNLVLGTGNHTLTFADSSTEVWTAGKTLTITGWVGGYNGTAASGANPRVFVGASATTLTASQLNQIQFFNGSNYFSAVLLASGQLVPSAAPRINTFSPTNACQGETITITGAGFTGATAVRVNSVNFASFTVVSSTTITAVLSTSNTTGVVTVVTPNGTFSSTNSLVVMPVPSSVTATPSSTAICNGGSVNLTASATPNAATATTLLSENFNAALVGWTLTNLSTGGTPANAAWTARPNSYNNGSETFNSNDNSQFYLTDSDAPGSGSITNTALQSPAFSTMGMSAATLTFYHYYRWNANPESGAVQVSTDGVNFTDVLNYGTATVGARNGFVPATYNLSAYLNQPTVYIRFKYDATYDWYWAIDNLVVSSTPATAATYAWTSTPSGYTSSTQNPTGVAPTATTTYNLTVTNNYGCTASASTSAVNVSAVPASGTLTPTPAAGTVCAGTSVSATATAGSGGAGTIVDELERSLSGGPYTAYTSGTAISTTGQTSVSIRTRRTATGSGCTSSTYNTITWTMSNVPTVGTISTPSALCAGGSFNPSAPSVTANGSTITSQGWEMSTVSGGGTYNPLTLPYTVAFADNGKNIRYTATNSCGTTTSNVVSLTVNSLSVAPTGITGTTTICEGTSTTLTVAGGSLGTGAIVEWYAVGCNAVPGGVGNSITVSPATSTTYYVNYNGTCNTTSCASQLITVNPRATASVISGSAAICSGTTTNIQVTITGGTSPYTVVYSAGTVGSYVSGTNIPVSPTSSTTYTLTSVTDANGCAGIGNSGSAAVTIDSTTSTNGGPWSNGSPSASKSAIFDGTNVSLGSDFAACSLTLVNSSIVTIQTGTDVNLSGALTVEAGSTFTLENNANLLQTIPSGTSYSNSGNIVVKRNSSALKRFDYTLWSSPVAGQGVYAFSKFTFGNRFYVYRTNSNTYNAGDIGMNITSVDANGVNGTDSNNVLFAPAKGYLIRTPWNHPTAPAIWNGTFTGVPRNGDISFTMTNGGLGQQFNLVGNPYPSPIDMTQFVFDNTTTNANITGTLYFWRETNNNTSNNAYCSWAGGTFTTNNEAQVFDPNGIIRTGQGFFVEADGAATTVNFRNAQRSSDNGNQFFKDNNVTNDVVETNRFWLNLTNATGEFSQMAAGYMTNATDGVDIYDGKNINTGSVLLNSILDNKDYTIQGKSLPFSPADVIPLSYKITTAGSYTIAIDHVDGLFTDTNQPIYLKDNLTSTEHNLQTGAYSFATDAGTFNSRFEIVYQSQLSNPVFTADSVIVYSQENDFVIHSGNAIMASVKVFDIRGRLLQGKTAINSNQTTIGGGLANQVLLIQITSDTGVVVTKKVVR